MNDSKLDTANYPLVTNELDFLQGLLSSTPWHALDIGCGTGDFLRNVTITWPGCTATGIEVDERQVLRCRELSPGLKVLQGVAQSLPLEDLSFDLVVMLKSLHHVPSDHMDHALREIARVLQPGGHLYVSEPLFQGPFNEVVRLFHDEQHVRAQAQAALDRAKTNGVWVEESDQVFMAPLYFSGYDDFERRIVKAPYENHQLSAETEEQVRQKFALHVGTDGAKFTRAVRIRLLRKVQSA